MESHSAAKSQPKGPFPTVATIANELASRKTRKMNGLTRRKVFRAALALGLGGALGSLDRVFGAGGPVKVRLGTSPREAPRMPNTFWPWANNGGKRRAGACY